MTQSTAHGSEAAATGKTETTDGSNLPYCDLLMKGGITSGVIYPGLIAVLSKQYRFKSIGGTSAGAIAAGGCAAAEFRRQRDGDDGGFAELAKLPAQLGKARALFKLFQPAESVRTHFDVLVSGLNEKGAAKSTGKVVAAMTRAFWAGPLLAAIIAWLLIGLVLMAVVDLKPVLAWAIPLLLLSMAAALLLIVVQIKASWRSVSLGFALAWLASTALLLALGSSWLMAAIAAMATVLVLVLTAGLAVLLAVTRFGSTLLRGLHGNFYGLCSGQSPAGGPVALTDWLTGYFNTLAGLEQNSTPLTFGDLWDGRDKDTEPVLSAKDTPTAQRRIHLQVMTTAVTQQMCYSLPFRDGAPAFYYDPTEWARLFPPSVMAWLAQVAAANPGSRDSVCNGARTRLERLPAGRHLPVVVAVRMSLSFPVLLSAVPLYAYDYSRQDEGEQKTAQRVWFSDGGIGSNLPLHFFDAPLPQHPTFAVNLKEVHPDYPIIPDKAENEGGRLYLPHDNRGGLQRQHAAPQDQSPAGILGFIWSIVTTMQNWRDEIQFPYPGYRDRIMQISQRPEEGGLNLDMPPETITTLDLAGQMAGQRLLDRFHPDSKADERGGWDNHETIRLRTFLAIMVELTKSPALASTHWDTVLDNANISAGDKRLGKEILAGLRVIGATAGSGGDSLINNAPKPRPKLTIAPRI